MECKRSLAMLQTSHVHHLLLVCACFPLSSAVPDISVNRRKPVQGLSLKLTCTSDVPITGTVTFRVGTNNKGACLSDGYCGSGFPRYTVTQNRAQSTTTLTINSTVSSEDNGTWTCQQEFSSPGPGQQAPPSTISNGLVLSQFATILDWSSMSYNPSLTSIPSSVTPQGQVSVTVTTPCAARAAVISWTHPQGVGGVPPSSTSSSQGSCQSGQVQTTNTLSLPGSTTSLYNRQISLTVSVEHDSFDPPTYIKSQTTHAIQFPVPISMLTLTNINSDHETLRARPGTSLTMTCETSPSFPTSNVTWSGLPSGTTLTVREVTTSGVLVETTSTVTFTVTTNDDGNVIQCTASNINGQPSPTSNRAVLETSTYGPDLNQISVTKPLNTEVIEKRDLTLTCQTLTSVSPGVTFTWDYNDGSAITGGTTGPVTGSAGKTWSQTRTFQPIRSKTNVRCRVRNIRAPVTATGTISFDVKFAPDITFTPVDVREGEVLTLSCEANGRPESYIFGRFTQYWGNTSIDTHIGSQTGGVYTWTTQTATYLDAGVYECSVDNGVTDIHDVLVQRKSVNVQVRAFPIFTMDTFKQIAAEIGSTVVVSQAFYNSNLNYTSVKWIKTQSKSSINRTHIVSMNKVTLKKNGKEVKLDGFVASVVINNFKEKDIGMYTVTVCNSIGCSSSDIKLSEAGPPLVPLELIVTNTTQRRISLRWKPNFPGGDFTQVFILHYRLQGSGDWLTQEYKDNPGGYVYAEITDLQPDSVYEFKVRARNNRDSDNEGDFTAIVQGSTKSNSQSSSSLGIGLGIGIGLCLPLTVGVIILVLYCRRRRISSQNNGNKEHSENREGNGEAESSCNRGDNAGLNGGQDRTEYSHLEDPSPQQYTQLEVYQNTGAHANEGMEYEKIADNPPATYETVALHEYSKQTDTTYTNAPGT